MEQAATSLVRTAADLGIEVCFANPGTTEMPVVNALDAAGGIRGILGLHENVCTGAADGYGRLAGKPALTLLHLGPGFANGVANLHNAKKARTPVVNVIGEHASWHQAADAPLHMDIDKLAETVSIWHRRIGCGADASRDLVQAHAAAMSRRGGVATLIFPHDYQEQPAADRASLTFPVAYSQIDGDRVDVAVELLRRAKKPVFLLGGSALFGEGLVAAGRLASLTGGDLLAEVGFSRLETGQGLPVLQRLPYFPEQAQETLDRYDAVVVCGTNLPVSFFGYGHLPSRYLDGRSDVAWIAGKDDDAVGAIASLADALDAPAVTTSETAFEIAPADGPLDAEQIGRALARQQPEGAIIVVTAVTSGFAYTAISPRALPHTQLALTGGAIGEGPALALGAAIACPDQRVINLEADGSGAYIVQALWSHAREQLPITTIICANHRYRILQLELERAGIAEPGPIANRLTDLGSPKLDWVSIARGFGVPAVRVDNGEALEQAIARAVNEPGPYLIEAAFGA